MWVLALQDEETDRLGPFKWAEARFARSKLSVDEVRDNLSDFLRSMETVVQGIPGKLGGLSVSTVSLKAEISAKGKVSLLGTGGELGGTGGITITLTRVSAAAKTPNNEPTEDSSNGDSSTEG